MTRHEQFFAAAMQGIAAGRIAARDRGDREVYWREVVEDAWDLADLAEASAHERDEKRRGLAPLKEPPVSSGAR